MQRRQLAAADRIETAARVTVFAREVPQAVREQCGVPAFIGAVLVQPGGEPARRRRRRQHGLPGSGLLGLALGLEVKPHQQRLAGARAVQQPQRGPLRRLQQPIARAVHDPIDTNRP